MRILGGGRCATKAYGTSSNVAAPCIRLHSAVRHLPPYVPNPFADLRIQRLRIEDAKPIFVFDAATELKFFQAADRWAFAIHFTLAKTGMRPGELVHLLIEEVDLERGWIRIRGKQSLGWRTKTGHDRVVPAVKELTGVLRSVIGERVAGLVFRRPRFRDGKATGADLGLNGLQRAYDQRLAAHLSTVNHSMARREQAGIAKAVWQDAGLVKVDAIRTSFIRIMTAIGHPEGTCPKSWRHSFATLLQDADVDPLVRQLTLGHKPVAPAAGALGMTTVYTHTRPETQRGQLEAALQRWPASLDYAQEWVKGGVAC